MGLITIVHDWEGELIQHIHIVSCEKNYFGVIYLGVHSSIAIEIVITYNI